MRQKGNIMTDISARQALAELKQKYQLADPVTSTAEAPLVKKQPAFGHSPEQQEKKGEPTVQELKKQVAQLTNENDLLLTQMTHLKQLLVEFKAGIKEITLKNIDLSAIEPTITKTAVVEPPTKQSTKQIAPKKSAKQQEKPDKLFPLLLKNQEALAREMEELEVSRQSTIDHLYDELFEKFDKLVLTENEEDVQK